MRKCWVPILGSLALALACGRQPSVPEAASGDAQKLPFDGESHGNGVSPTQSLVPAATRLPEGASIAIRLRAPLSSSSAHAGDTFDGTIQEAVVDEGQTLVPQGAAVIGRVLDAKQSAGIEPGYLRIAVVSVEVGGKTVLIDTSSIFAKAGARDKAATKEVLITPGRRLTFHVTRGADLP